MSASPEAVPPIEDQVEAVFTTDDRAGMEQLDVSLAAAEAQHTHAGETEAPGRTLKGSDSLMELMAAPSDYKSRDMGHLMQAVYETEEKKQNPPASKTDSSPQGGVQ